ncbi:hypothetical protein KJ682_06110 [bacterium]|nr:hypothetical protein [bacterium]
MRLTGACVLLMFSLAAWPAAAQSPADQLDGLDWGDASFLAMRAIPGTVYEGRPDSLLDWIDAWWDAGGPEEPMTRILILGAIWDGQFDHQLYGYEIVDLLLWFTDPQRLSGDSPRLSGDLATATADPDPYRAAVQEFDAFTRAFADQLLPHQPVGTEQEFFCLYYSGRTREAWRRLDSEAMKGTTLRGYRDRREDALKRQSGLVFAGITGGFWSPFGKYAFAGDHALVGLQYGMQGKHWLVRLVVESRLGRTDRPYLADQDGIRGASDRFNALLLGFELGRALYQSGRWQVNVFGGLGMDAVKPFGEEEVMLQALHLSAGAGWRLDLGSRRQWFTSVDYRREWIGSRNEQGTEIYGDAWSVRLGVGANFGQENRDKLRRLAR